MKPCIRCRQVKQLDEFYRHDKMRDGYLNKCKECCKNASKQRQDNCREYVATYEKKRKNDSSRKQKVLQYQNNRRRNNPHKVRAYNMVARAIKSGRLKRKPCEVCGDSKVQAHHDNYLIPLKVRWLCFKCHREKAHGQTVN